MKKKFAVIILSIAIFVSSLSISASPIMANSIDTNSAKQTGLTLDISRRFYNVDAIKQYIDLLSEIGADYLQLHFSDDQNYAIESEILNQTVDNAILVEGTYYNTAPQEYNPDRFEPRPFLSSAQVLDISEYALQQGIELIPDLDTPGHMWGIRDLFTFNGMDESIFKDGINELDVSKEEAREFAKNLWSEAMEMFPYSTRVHLGGDEFTHTNQFQIDFANYVNELLNHLQTYHDIEKVLIWNDCVKVSNIDIFDKDVQITYWRYSDWGNTDNVSEPDKMTLPELLDRGFEVYNYNGYYLYFVPSDRAMTQESIDYREQDMINNWNLGVWDQNSDRELEIIPENMLGSAITIWGENSANYSLQEIYDAIEQQIIDLNTINKTFQYNDAKPSVTTSLWR